MASFINLLARAVAIINKIAVWIIGGFAVCVCLFALIGSVLILINCQFVSEIIKCETTSEREEFLGFYWGLTAVLTFGSLLQWISSKSLSIATSPSTGWRIAIRKTREWIMIQTLIILVTLTASIIADNLVIAVLMFIYIGFSIFVVAMYTAGLEKDSFVMSNIMMSTF